MKRLLILFTATLFAASAAWAADVPVKFTWDADVEAETTVPWERLLFYASDESGVYDYLDPITVLQQSYVDGLSTPSELQTIIEFADGVESTKYFIVVAGSGELKSEDSDEVSMTVDLAPLTAFTFDAVYNETAKTIDFAWTAADARVERWELYVADVDAGPFTKVAEVPFGESGQSVSVPQAEMFPDGVLTTKYFTMVSFGKYGVFSPNATTVGITVDNRKEVGGVINFKIFLTD
jgi:hypothetical protein